MKANRRKTGSLGEEIASQFLQEAGLSIIDRNWQRAGGEIDIIATEGRVLVFVEVRTRSTRGFGSAEESVDWRKQRQVRKMATLYLSEAPRGYRQFRFDVVAVYLSGRERKIERVHHIRNAF